MGSGVAHARAAPGLLANGVRDAGEGFADNARGRECEHAGLLRREEDVREGRSARAGDNLGAGEQIDLLAEAHGSGIDDGESRPLEPLDEVALVQQPGLPDPLAPAREV